ncbi:hypothetical protein PINS_up020907 [Pythium insidiosum]|nr:hypothetical protein PINS_up020907 [Pythium insidiosum]
MLQPSDLSDHLLSCSLLQSAQPALTNASGTPDAPPSAPVVTSDPIAVTEPPATTPGPVESPRDTLAPDASAVIQTPLPAPVPDALAPPFPTPDAPVPALDPPAPDTNTPLTSAQTCTVTTSSGDLAAGAFVITDASCVNGGLGCFGDVCRFCKYFESDKSSHLLPCSNFGDVVVPTTPPVDLNATCNQHASSGDLAVGVNMETDIACVSGGLGCIADSVCRLCKVRDTPQSRHLQPCVNPQATPTPPAPASPPVVGDCVHQVSSGDLQAGVSAVDDASCAQGGLGCFSNACRFCKAWETPQSSHMLSCAELLNPTVPALRAAAVSSVTSGGLDVELQKLLHNDGMRYSFIGAAVVGVVAVVAAAVIGTKRVFAATRSRSTRADSKPSSDDGADIDAGATTVADDVNGDV